MTPDKPQFLLDQVTEEEYETAGSKFITFPPGAQVGDSQFRTVEVTDFDWDTPGTSMKVEVKVTEEGPDQGKEEKLSFGVGKLGIWKGREIYLAVAGKEMPMAEGAGGKRHPAPDPMDLVGKPAEGHWQMQAGVKGGVPGGEPVLYPKLVALLKAGTRPKVEGLGI